MGLTTQPFSFRFQPVLGTELHVLVGAGAAVAAERAQRRVLDEILRIEALLSTYRDDTPLSRWIRAEVDEDLPEEVVTVLALAQAWFVASGGTFHPALGGVRARWREAARSGHLPARSECRELAAEAACLPYTVRTRAGVRCVEQTRDCADLDLDALAKGWIVDRAAEIGVGPDVDWVMVNVGGDLRLVGPGSVRVAIEDPTSTVDNARPMAVVTVGPGGLASSGPARRGFEVAGEWFGHVLDPRTGWPVEGPGGVTVSAPDTATADALTTVVGVAGLGDPAVTRVLEDHDAAALVVGADGVVQMSLRWLEQVTVQPPSSG